MATEGSGYAPRPAPRLAVDAHKGDAGRVLCVCGSRDMPGAAILVTRAAQRAGAGLVTLACFDREALAVVPQSSPETIYLDLSGTRDFISGRLPSELDGRADQARVVGPGLGASSLTYELLRRLVEADYEGSLVLDADALNVLAGAPEVLAAHAGQVVVTPHPGEAARLLGAAVGSESGERREAALAIARRSGAICCLKGQETLITDGERVVANTSGNRGMATAGAGDVLAGILGAYLAAAEIEDGDWTHLDAVAAAVHVHGLAADLALKERGERGLIASDLIEFLPAAQLAFEAKSGAPGDASRR